MAPVPTSLEQSETGQTIGVPPPDPVNEFEGTSILHRTPWIPPVASSAEGIYITLRDGRKLIDGVGGASVSAIGMGHPAVVKAVQDQVAKVAYVYNMQLSNEPAEELARLLVDTSDGAFSHVGFVSGGTEAMEAALKLARQYYFEQGDTRRCNFIAREMSFHGNSIGTLSAGHHPGRRAPYESILNQARYHHVGPAYAYRYKQAGESEAEYVERLAKELNEKFLELGPETVIAFMAETVVGATTGCVPPPKGYFPAMKAVCDKYGALFILDEVMSGMGRMGTMHAWQAFGDGVRPDIQAVAKGLGGGYLPIGAVLMNQKVADGIRDRNGFWRHGHTYQAHPVACAGSLAVQKVIRTEDLLTNTRARGDQLESLLRASLTADSHFVADIRGGGLFWGVEFEIPSDVQTKLGKKRFGALVQERAFENSLVIMGMSGTVDGVTGEHAILSPALNVSSEEVEEIVRRFVKSVEDARALI